MLLLQDGGAAPKGLCTEAERELLLTGEFRLCDSQHGRVYFILCVKKKREGEKEEINPAAAKQGLTLLCQTVPDPDFGSWLMSSCFWYSVLAFHCPSLG